MDFVDELGSDRQLVRVDAQLFKETSQRPLVA
jgi:hypothetical protein